ncbi:MAG: hypothetical protein KY476_19615, partial [Planctomycetes bacterium]|nr:hypothetical protein [Planctomycetota bacterium]
FEFLNNVNAGTHTLVSNNFADLSTIRVFVQNDPLINLFGQNTDADPGFPLALVPDAINSLSTTTRVENFVLNQPPTANQLQSALPQLFVRETVISDAAVNSTQIVVTQTTDATTVISDPSVVEERVVVVEVLRPDGTVLGTVNFIGEEADDFLASYVSKYLKKLPDGRYRIWLKEPGEQRARLFRDLFLRDGVPTDVRERQRDETPGASIEGDADAAPQNAAQPVPADETAAADVFWERWTAPPVFSRTSGAAERDQTPLRTSDRERGDAAEPQSGLTPSPSSPALPAESETAPAAASAAAALAAVTLPVLETRRSGIDRTMAAFRQRSARTIGLLPRLRGRG